MFVAKCVVISGATLALLVGVGFWAEGRLCDRLLALIPLGVSPGCGFADRFCSEMKFCDDSGIQDEYCSTFAAITP